MKKFEQIINEGKKVYLITHSGVCHTDDIATTAILEYLLEENNIETEVIRTRDKKDLEGLTSNIIIYDVFDGELDHHDPNRQISQDGRTLAAIGLTWRWLKTYLIDDGFTQSDWEFIDKTFISPIDKTDCTGEMTQLSFMINSMRDTNCAGSMNDTTFRELVDFVKISIKSIFMNLKKKNNDRKRYYSLKVLNKKGLKIRINNTGIFIPNFIKEDEEADIFVFEDKNEKVYKVFTNSGQLKPNDGYNFLHSGGWFGIIGTDKNLIQILTESYKLS